MDDLDDITEVAVGETRELLLQSEQLLLRPPVDAAALAELFQRIHTAKSNLAVVPAPRQLSHLLQNLETVLARLRATGQGIGPALVEPVLRVVQSAMELLEARVSGLTPVFELEVQRRLNALRLASSSLGHKEAA